MREEQKEAFQEKQKKAFSEQRSNNVESRMPLELSYNEEIIDSLAAEVLLILHQFIGLNLLVGLESLLLSIPFLSHSFLLLLPHSILIILQITPRALQLVLNLLISFLL